MNPEHHTAAPTELLPVSTATPALAYDLIAHALAERSQVALDGALPATLLARLQRRVLDLPGAAFHAAGVGRQGDHGLQPNLRSDRIHWLHDSDPDEAAWLNWGDGLRQYLNRQHYMGLQVYEAHFAHYAPGQRYGRHLDAFRGQANRVVSTVLYLNDAWAEADGGELVLEEPNGQRRRVLPQPGRLVVFLSEEVPHEVLRARRDRYSIAGWFRVRGAVA